MFLIKKFEIKGNVLFLYIIKTVFHRMVPEFPYLALCQLTWPNLLAEVARPI